MSFYESINQYYEKIFPLNLKQVEFIKRMIPNGKKLLEVGSAKGALTKALSGYYDVVGIDLDDSFIKASKRLYPTIDFRCLNMMEIANNFKDSSFDAIVCFGNTLVHLDSEEMIDTFIGHCYKVLKRSGILTFQIINYEYILRQKIDHLPTIKNESIEFIRNYEFEKTHIRFNTTLKVMNTLNKVSNSILLYPIGKTTLHHLLLKHGFKEISFQSSFDRNVFDDSKILLIVHCKK